MEQSEENSKIKYRFHFVVLSSFRQKMWGVAPSGANTTRMFGRRTKPADTRLCVTEQAAGFPIIQMFVARKILASRS
jgi:hypothetical protein